MSSRSDAKVVRMKIIVLLAVVFFVSPVFAAYELGVPPPSWKPLLERKVSFEGAAPMSEFLSFIFSQSQTNYSFERGAKTELYIKASFTDLSVVEVLKAISAGSTVRVSWGYAGNSSSPARIEIFSGPIDLMDKDIDVSQYPAKVTLIPRFSQKTGL